MTKNNLGLAAIVIIAIAISSWAFKPNVNVSVDGPSSFGASAGPEHFIPQHFRAGMTDGGGCFSTTTSGTLNIGDLERNNCIYLAAAGAGQAAVTFTLPASTTASALLPGVGSCRTWWFDASDVAAATTTTFAAGTGHDVVGLDATGAGTGADVIDGAEFGILRMCRQQNSDVTSFVQEYIHAD